MNAITATEMDADETVKPPEQPQLSSIDDVSGSNGNPEETLQCLSSGVQQATEHTQTSVAPISSYTGDLGNDFFQDSILEINESLQDIDKCRYIIPFQLLKIQKVLSDIQFWRKTRFHLCLALA